MRRAAPVPDPATLIGRRCRIQLKRNPAIVRRILAIDADGVKIEENDGSARVLTFSDISRVAPAPRKS